VLAVECIDVVDDAGASEESASSSEITEQLLVDELGRCSEIVNGDSEGRHVFCYSSVSCSRNRVYLRSPSSVTRSLAA
jgi:hypothetical protein